jgi:hypothetical protein
MTSISNKLELARKYRDNINIHMDSNLVLCINQVIEILEDLTPIHKVNLPFNTKVEKPLDAVASADSKKGKITTK